MPSDQNTKKYLVVQKCGHNLWLLSTSYTNTIQYNHQVERTQHPSPCSPTQYPHDKEHHNNKIAKIAGKYGYQHSAFLPNSTNYQ